MSTQNEVERIKSVYQGYADQDIGSKLWSDQNPGNQAMSRERANAVHQLLQAANYVPLQARTILDVGCGSGRVLANFLDWGASPENLYGIDLLPERIANAQANYPRLHFMTANAEKLDFPEQYFDLIVLFTVFSSILDQQMAHNIAGEINRVLKTNGSIIWYDFRYKNPKNPHTRPIRPDDLQQLFPNFSQQLQLITLLPPLARRFGRLTGLLYPVFAALPWLCTHYVGLLRKG